MTAAREALGARIRSYLADTSPVREAAMFGGLAFMVDERMVVCVRKDGGLLVRLVADRFDELVTRPGAHPAEMGAGRTMGRTWLEVSPDGLTTGDQLASWVEIGCEAARAAQQR